jgi:hypothetical protein
MSPNRWNSGSGCVSECSSSVTQGNLPNFLKTWKFKISTQKLPNSHIWVRTDRHVLMWLRRDLQKSSLQFAKTIVPERMKLCKNMCLRLSKVYDTEKITNILKTGKFIVFHSESVKFAHVCANQLTGIDVSRGHEFQKNHCQFLGNSESEQMLFWKRVCFRLLELYDTYKFPNFSQTLKIHDFRSEIVKFSHNYGRIGRHVLTLHDTWFPEKFSSFCGENCQNG